MGAGDVERLDDVHALLHAYDRALEQCRKPPRSRILRWPLPARQFRFPRVRFGLRNFLVRHVRRNVEALLRLHYRRLALDPSSRETDAQRSQRDSLEQFRASLPGPRHPLAALLPVTVFLVLTSALLGEVEGSSPDPDHPQWRQNVAKLSSPNANGISEFVIEIFSSDLDELLGLAFAVSLAAYATFRLLVPGHELKRRLLDLPRANAGRRAQTDIATAVARGVPDGRAIGVGEREREVFGGLGARVPVEFPLDLAVKATIVAPFLFVGIVALEAGDSWIAGFFLVPALARLAWLGGAWIRRLVD